MIKLILPDNIGKIIGVHTFTLRDVTTGKIISENTYKNVFTTAGKIAIAARLAGGSDDTDITYGAVGTGAGTPAIGDTTLFTEEARTTIIISSSSNVISVTTFFGSAEANAILTEFGLFGNGATAAADSGTLWTHNTISETKSASETLTVSSIVTIG